MAGLYVENATIKPKRNHIDYNKKNCNPKNLITLCRKCHSKTNSNRDYWINYFGDFGFPWPVVNVCYGTGEPLDPTTVPEGTLYIQYST